MEKSQIIFAIFFTTALLILLVGFLFFVFIWYRKRSNNYIKEKQLMQSNFQQEILKTQLEIQEQTFKNISQEIHDNIGQTLSFIKLNINLVSDDVTDGDKEKLSESKNLLTKVIQDLRDLSKTLNTDFIKEIGLIKAIEQQLQLLQKTGIYTTQLIVKGTFYKFPLNSKLVVYRVVQEVLNNIVKHAEATTINIEMKYETEKLCITINDNGKGFDTKELSSHKGIGLRNMINRMQLINGSVTVNSIPEKGTSVIIELPK